jgi:hypothetical protein
LSLGGLSQIAGSEAVLPAYLIGMAVAPSFLNLITPMFPLSLLQQRLKRGPGGRDDGAQSGAISEGDEFGGL